MPALPMVPINPWYIVMVDIVMALPMVPTNPWPIPLLVWTTDECVRTLAKRYTVMAHIVMAYIVMVYIVMAYIVRLAGTVSQGMSARHGICLSYVRMNKRADMLTNYRVCGHVCRHVCRYVYRHLCRHVCKHVHVNMYGHVHVYVCLYTCPRTCS